MKQEIISCGAMAGMVKKYGLLPMFENQIAGFSIEEHTPRSFWFAENTDGPWEWKGPVIRQTRAAYGKFFRNKAGYITPELYLDFANYRRDGYDFDARYDDGLASHTDLLIYTALLEHGSLLTGEWRQESGFAGKEKKGAFESAVTRLQMQGYVVVTDFEYAKDKSGKTYGWGVARYSTPEAQFGSAFTEHVYQRAPQESKELLLETLRNLCPRANEKDILKMIG